MPPPPEGDANDLKPRLCGIAQDQGVAPLYGLGPNLPPLAGYFYYPEWPSNTCLFRRFCLDPVLNIIRYLASIYERWNSLSYYEFPESIFPFRTEGGAETRSVQVVIPQPVTPPTYFRKMVVQLATYLRSVFNKLHSRLFDSNFLVGIEENPGPKGVCKHCKKEVEDVKTHLETAHPLSCNKCGLKVGNILAHLRSAHPPSSQGGGGPRSKKNASLIGQSLADSDAKSKAAVDIVHDQKDEIADMAAEIRELKSKASIPKPVDELEEMRHRDKISVHKRSYVSPAPVCKNDIQNINWSKGDLGHLGKRLNRLVLGDVKLPPFFIVRLVGFLNFIIIFTALLYCLAFFSTPVVEEVCTSEIPDLRVVYGGSCEQNIHNVWWNEMMTVTGSAPITNCEGDYQFTIPPRWTNIMDNNAGWTLTEHGAIANWDAHTLHDGDYCCTVHISNVVGEVCFDVPQEWTAKARFAQDLEVFRSRALDVCRFAIYPATVFFKLITSGDLIWNVADTWTSIAWFMILGIILRFGLKVFEIVIFPYICSGRLFLAWFCLVANLFGCQRFIPKVLTRLNAAPIYGPVYGFMELFIPDRIRLVAVPIRRLGDTSDFGPEFDQNERRKAHSFVKYQLAVEVKWLGGYLYFKDVFDLSEQWRAAGRHGSLGLRLKTLVLNEHLLATGINRKTMLASTSTPDVALATALRLVSSNGQYHEHPEYVAKGRSSYRDMALVLGAVVTRSVYVDHEHF